jgi:hypothetical protein
MTLLVPPLVFSNTELIRSRFLVIAGLIGMEDKEIPLSGGSPQVSAVSFL